MRLETKVLIILALVKMIDSYNCSAEVLKEIEDSSYQAGYEAGARNQNARTKQLLIDFGIGLESGVAVGTLLSVCAISFCCLCLLTLCCCAALKHCKRSVNLFAHKKNDDNEGATGNSEEEEEEGQEEDDKQKLLTS